MIGDVRARVAAIEHRLGIRPTPTPAAEPRPNRAGGAQFELATGAMPLGRSGPRPGTLGALWASALQGAAPPDALYGAGWMPGPGAPYAGNVPAAADRYRASFEAAGARYGVDPDLLAAVAWTESNFDPGAVSHAGAIGLMQIMPGTASGLGVDPWDPVQAIDGAARYLRQQLDRFGDTRLALAAYNAGPGAVQRHGGIPPYDETIAYVGKVLTRYDHLRSAS